ncbi:MAG: protein kinase, partial [Deltaproteobacteria bacterium]|nr:protein kinase [Deltaproteobacteria bacterium]
LLSLGISKEDRLQTVSDLAAVYLKTDRLESALERLVQIYHDDPHYFPDLRKRIDELREALGMPALDAAGTEQNLAISIMAAASDASIAYTTTMEARFSHYFEELNKQPKVKLSNPVEYSFDQSAWSTGYYTYLSMAGMFVITYAPIPVGSLVFLRFNLPDDKTVDPVSVIGQAVRQESLQDQSDGVLGMEVRFIKIENDQESVLQSFIQEKYIEEEEAAQEPEKIRFLCDRCGRIVSVERVGCGKHVNCLCGESVFVPYPEHTPTKKNPLRGMQLASCRIDDVVGKGGAATVYKGHHLALDIPVAIKVLHPGLKEFGSEVVKRFLREARVVARITHPNIIRVMNAGEEEGHNFIVMQYIRGGSLADFLNEGTEISLNDFLRIFVDICSALTAAHQQTVVHGDIKPANILLTHGGRAMLGDFGLVRILRKS